MDEPMTVRLTLQNLSKTSWTFSLEPYGDYCELRPAETVYATWDVRLDGARALEIAVTDDSMLIGDVSQPLGELRPSRNEPGGERWA